MTQSIQGTPISEYSVQICNTISFLISDMLDVVQKALFKTSLSSYSELFFLKSCKCLKHKAISKAVFSKLALRIDTKLKPLSRGYMIVGTGCQKEYEKMSLQVLLWK